MGSMRLRPGVMLPSTTVERAPVQEGTFDGKPCTLRNPMRAKAGRVVVTNDAVTSYLGAIGFEPGAVVAAGTGVIALAGDRDGNFARSDGWGYILGADGGGWLVTGR
jgi:N-acetylglucosamine kinase-like BadF-type ATPase